MIDKILDERRKTYGPFDAHAMLTQSIKEVMHDGVGDIITNWGRFSASQKEALEMIAHKIGRILNGDPDYIDSWVDIAGYAQLIVKELELENDIKSLSKQSVLHQLIVKELEVLVKDLIDDIIETEGGYVNHPKDKGGPTKYGITQRTLSQWRNKFVTADDVKHMDKNEAYQIYLHEYYHLPKINLLPHALRPIVTDMAANHGPETAVRLLQEVVDRMSGKQLAIDGAIGPKTIAACVIAHNVYGSDVISQIVKRRKQYYKNILKHDPTQAVFLTGWLRRADKFLTS